MWGKVELQQHHVRNNGRRNWVTEKICMNISKSTPRQMYSGSTSGACSSVGQPCLHEKSLLSNRTGDFGIRTKFAQRSVWLLNGSKYSLMREMFILYGGAWIFKLASLARRPLLKTEAGCLLALRLSILLFPLFPLLKSQQTLRTALQRSWVADTWVRESWVPSLKSV